MRNLDAICDELIAQGKIVDYTRQFGGHHVIVKTETIVCVSEADGAYHEYEGGHVVVDTNEFLESLKQ